MSEFNGNKTREYKSGNTPLTGTLAKGEYFAAEFNRLYENDNHLNDTKFEKAGGIIDGDTTINGKVVINGDVTVEGGITKVFSTDLEVEDKVITLNKGETGSSVTGGFSGNEVDRGTGEKFTWGLLESVGRFVAGFGTALKKLITEDDCKIDAIASSIAMRDNTGDLTARVLKSTAATGSAPLSIASSTKVDNLNADKLDGYDAGNIAGNIPVNNGTLCTNLNADLIDGYNSAPGAGSVPATGGVIPVISKVTVTGNTTLAAMDVGEMRFINSTSSSSITITISPTSRFFVFYTTSAGVNFDYYISVSSFGLSSNGRCLIVRVS